MREHTVCARNSSIQFPGLVIIADYPFIKPGRHCSPQHGEAAADRLLDLKSPRCYTYRALQRSDMTSKKPLVFQRIRRIDSAPTIDHVVSQLRDSISRGELRPGDRLPPERELALRLGVSRPSIRAGLRSLIVMGILRARQGSGTS